MKETFQYRKKPSDGSPKKKRLESHYFSWGLTAFLVIAAGICFYYLIFQGTSWKAAIRTLIDILMPVVFGFAIAYLLTPVLNFIEYRLLFPLCDKLHIKDSPKRKSLVRGGGILITTILFFTTIYCLCAMILSQIVPSIITISDNFDTYINNITNWANGLLENNNELRDYIVAAVDRYSDEIEVWLNKNVFSTTGELIKRVSLSALGVLLFLWDFIIGFVISIYVLASKEKFAAQAKKMAYAFFETPTANVIINNFRFAHKTFSGFISGKVLDSFIIGLLCFAGTSMMNMPYALLISVVIGFTNVIPFFGPFLGAVPCTVLLFVVDPMHPLKCLYFVLFIFALQQFDGNVLGPQILGESTGLTGFWVIFAITFFGGLFNVVGMIVGVPIMAVIYAAVRSFVNIQLQKRSLPERTEDYMDVGSIDEDGFHSYIPEYRQHKEKKKDNGLLKKSQSEQKKSGSTEEK